MKKSFVVLLFCILTSCCVIQKPVSNELDNKYLSQFRDKKVLNVIQMKDCVIIFFTDGTQLKINNK